MEYTRRVFVSFDLFKYDPKAAEKVIRQIREDHPDFNVRHLDPKDNSYRNYADACFSMIEWCDILITTQSSLQNRTSAMFEVEYARRLNKQIVKLAMYCKIPKRGMIPVYGNHDGY